MSHESFRELMNTIQIGPRICASLPQETLLQLCLVCRWLYQVIAPGAHATFTLHDSIQFAFLDSLVQSAIELVNRGPIDETNQELVKLRRVISTLNHTQWLVLRLNSPNDDFNGDNFNPPAEEFNEDNNASVQGDNQSIHSAFGDVSDNGNDLQSEGQMSLPHHEAEDYSSMDNGSLRSFDQDPSGWHSPTLEERMAVFAEETDYEARSERNTSSHSPFHSDNEEHSVRESISVDVHGSLHNEADGMREGSAHFDPAHSRIACASQILEADFMETVRQLRTEQSNHLPDHSGRPSPTHSQSRSGSASPEAHLAQLSWAERFATLIRYGTPSTVEDDDTRTTPVHLRSPSPSTQNSENGSDDGVVHHVERNLQDTDEAASNVASSVGTWPSQVSSDTESVVESADSSVALSASVTSAAQEELEELDNTPADNAGDPNGHTTVSAFRAFTHNLRRLYSLVDRVLERNPIRADQNAQRIDGLGNESSLLLLIPFLNVQSLVFHPFNFSATGALQGTRPAPKYCAFPCVTRVGLHLTADSEQSYVWMANISEVLTSLAPKVEVLVLEFVEWSGVDIETYEHLHQLNIDHAWQRFEHLRTIELFLDRKYIISETVGSAFGGGQDIADYGQHWGAEAVDMAARVLVDWAMGAGNRCSIGYAEGCDVRKPGAKKITIHLPSRKKIVWRHRLPLLLQLVHRDQVRLYGQVMVQVEVFHREVVAITSP